MLDSTEDLRRSCLKAINLFPRTREELTAICGAVWDPDELQQEFVVRSFLAPLVFVTRRFDGSTGCMLFQHWPRYYFLFHPKEEE